MIEVTAPAKDITLVKGGHLCRMASQTTRTLPDLFEEPARAHGCVVTCLEPDAPVVKQVPEPVATVDPEPESDEAQERIAQIAVAMKDILDSGDRSLLTGDGIPRAAEIETRVGFDTSKEEREAALALIDGDE